MSVWQRQYIEKLSVIWYNDFGIMQMKGRIMNRFDLKRAFGGGAMA